MAVSKCMVLLLSVLAVAVAQNVRDRRQLILGVNPLIEDDGSYFPGKYPDDPVALPYAGVPFPYAPYIGAGPVPVYPAGDNGDYFPGKYGPESQ